MRAQEVKKRSSRRLTFVDLFCGAGGFSLGFRAAGFVPVKAVDSDADCVATYVTNFGQIAEQAHLSPRTLPALHPDVIIGGPPCQPFSLLGKKQDYDPREGLTKHFMDAVAKLCPKVFVIENVPGYLRSVQADYVSKVSRRLGYRLTASILDAADHGVPQHRKRAFIVGSRLGWPFLPQSMDAESATVWNAIRDLNGEPTGENWHVSRSFEPISLKRFRAVPPGGNRLSLPRELQSPCWRGNHRGSVDVFGRLWWDRPSVTIRTEFIKPEKGRYLHPESHRPLTPREGARLQSFPDSFSFAGSMTSIVRQIGNAVPPRLAYRLALAVKAHLKGVEGEVATLIDSGMLNRTYPREVTRAGAYDCVLRANLLRHQ